MKLTINDRYMAMHGLFCMFFCVSFGFISLYLQGCGMSNAGIGIMTYPRRTDWLTFPIPTSPGSVESAYHFSN